MFYSILCLRNLFDGFQNALFFKGDNGLCWPLEGLETQSIVFDVPADLSEMWNVFFLNDENILTVKEQHALIRKTVNRTDDGSQIIGVYSIGTDLSPTPSELG